MHSFDPKVVRANKHHWCTWCGEKIEAGELYQTWTTVDSGWYRSKMHCNCYAIHSTHMHLWIDNSANEYLPYENTRAEKCDRYELVAMCAKVLGYGGSMQFNGFRFWNSDKVWNPYNVLDRARLMNDMKFDVSWSNDAILVGKTMVKFSDTSLVSSMHNDYVTAILIETIGTKG